MDALCLLRAVETNSVAVSLCDKSAVLREAEAGILIRFKKKNEPSFRRSINRIENYVELVDTDPLPR